MKDSIWFIICSMAVATFLTRRMMLNVPESILSKWMKRGLRYMPIGIFCALVIPVMFVKQNQWMLNLDYLIAGGVCIVLYYWKRHFLYSFIGGVGTAVIFSVSM